MYLWRFHSGNQGGNTMEWLEALKSRSVNLLRVGLWVGLQHRIVGVGAPKCQSVGLGVSENQNIACVAHGRVGMGASE
jgi:hypothetical protein